MKKLFEKFKEGIIIGLGILTTLSIGVFAYQFTNYENIEDVEMGQTLTKDIFNQLLTNVRSLKHDLDTLSGSVGRKGSDIVIAKDWEQRIYLGGGTASALYTPEITFAKGVYLIFPHEFLTISDSGRVYYGASVSSGNGQITGNLSRNSSNIIGEVFPFVLSVKSDTVNVKFFAKNVLADIGVNATITNITGSGGTAFTYVKISD